MKPDKIPKTDSINELATFWDHHDISDYETELEEVRDAVFEKKPEKRIDIKLDIKEYEILHKIAHEKGISDKALLQEWIREKLNTV